MSCGMDRGLVGVLLLAMGSLARLDRQGQQQAVSYSHVVRDHGAPTPYRVSQGYPSYAPQVTNLHNTHVPVISKQLPYSVQQSYPLSLNSHVPYAVGVPVAIPIDRPYKVNVPKPYPVTVEKPYALPVEQPYSYPGEYPAPLATPAKPYEGRGYETYEPQSEEQEEANYSGSEEEYD